NMRATTAARVNCAIRLIRFLFNVLLLGSGKTQRCEIKTNTTLCNFILSYLFEIRRQGSSREKEPLAGARRIPSFFILATKVVRFSPSRAAAPPDPPITQPASRNACKIRARVESSNVRREGVIARGFLSDTGRGFLTAFLSDVGSGFGSTPFFDRMTARSIKFWSSRTLPGQG